MVLYFIDDHYKLAIKWGIISLIVFVIPDIYIFAGNPANIAGTRIIVVLCPLIIGSMMALAVVTIVRKIRKGRAERSRAARSRQPPSMIMLELATMKAAILVESLTGNTWRRAS